MRIGIELNGVVRDINKQYVKYYVKDIDPSFDDTLLNYNVVNILPQLKFNSRSDKEKFVYEDYPYELFGCAPTVSRNLHTFINGWIYELFCRKGINDVAFFSMDEKELSIQSTYFYLSKSGSRIRKVVFPNNIRELSKSFDIVISSNPEYLDYVDGIKILIYNEETSEHKDKYDFSYQSLEELMKDCDFVTKIRNFRVKDNVFTKIKNKIKKFFCK